MKKAELRRVGTAVVVAALLGGLADPATGTASPADTRTVSYHGYRAVIPASWRVVDLADNPGACVRFDEPTVYLGHPGDQSTCPAHLVGRAAAILIEALDPTVTERISDDVRTAAPGTATAPPSAPSRDGMIQVAAEAAGVLVTAMHAPDTEGVVRQILAGARLTGAGTAATLPRRVEHGVMAGVTPQPGTVLGKGFDACTAPSQATMDKWLSASPYRTVGVYLSGASRACAQPNLTASWVSTQVGKGWHLILIDVGKQAPCSSLGNKMSGTPSTARSQGSDAAQASVRAAQALGIPAGSAIYSDIENYASTASCKAAVLSYLSGWTDALHALGYLSGFYSSVSSGIRDAASGYNDSGYTRVDHIWFAWWNSKADTDTGSYAPASHWADHQRIHQYAGNTSETWGGASINIDRNYVDLQGGTPSPPSACASVNLDFAAYPPLSPGAAGNEVTAAQCLLEAAGHQPGEGDPTGVFDDATGTATRAFQQSVGLPATGDVDSHTWTALLAVGDTPTLRNGSTGAAVRRLQRALTAASNRTVGIDGVFGSLTDQATRDYQSSRGLGSDGIAGAATWAALQAGR